MDSHDVRRGWEDRSGEYSPEYYAYYGPNDASELIRSRLDRSVPRDASILELGCSSGRHLAHLADNGFADLHGVEINDDAIEVMADTYPDLAADGTFYVDAIENVITDFETDRFDAVYSVETLQHLHPDVSWVFDEVARITDDLLITVENEAAETDADATAPETSATGEPPDDADSALSAVTYVHDTVPLYHRDWNQVFTARGFTEVAARPNGQDTIRTFRSRE